MRTLRRRVEREGEIHKARKRIPTRHDIADDFNRNIRELREELMRKQGPCEQHAQVRSDTHAHTQQHTTTFSQQSTGANLGALKRAVVEVVLHHLRAREEEQMVTRDQKRCCSRECGRGIMRACDGVRIGMGAWVHARCEMKSSVCARA